jgi:hypothetical protein
MLEVWWALTRRRIVPIHHKPQLPTLIPNHPCSHCHVYAHDVDHCFTFHLELWQGQSQNTLDKGQGFRKGKEKGAANKRLPTKLAQGQPNTMEAKFA